jgi:hypothetical protein
VHPDGLFLHLRTGDWWLYTARSVPKSAREGTSLLVMLTTKQVVSFFLKKYMQFEVMNFIKQNLTFFDDVLFYWMIFLSIGLAQAVIRAKQNLVHP